MKIKITETQLRKVVNIISEVVTYGVKGGEITFSKNKESDNKVDVCFGERCMKYIIIGSPIFGSDVNVNFKDIYKKPNGDLVFNRWVKGGKTEPNIIPKKDIYGHLISSFKNGDKKIVYDISNLGNLIFKRV